MCLAVRGLQSGAYDVAVNLSEIILRMRLKLSAGIGRERAAFPRLSAWHPTSTPLPALPTALPLKAT